MSAAIIPSMWSSFVMEESPEQMVRTMLQYGYRCTELSDEHSAVLLDRGDPETVGAKFKRFMDEQGFSNPQGHLLLHCCRLYNSDAAAERSGGDHGGGRYT